MYIRLKGIVDNTIVIAFAVIMIVPLIILTFYIRLKMGSPVLFKQSRAGINGRHFEIYKFRSMSNERDKMGVLLPDAQRLTAFGRFLRSSSLDELPGLINVLRGEMSIIGPRPLLINYIPLYSVRQFRRHEVKPGITGWAQVNGRNALSWEDKFEHDVWYVDHRSLALDLRILLLTVQKVFKREGISAQGDATMPVFRGSSSGQN